MNYKSFNLGDWIGHISGAIEDERELDGNEMRDLVEFLSRQNQESILDKIFCIVHPLSIMSTPEWEHKAIMQIAEMLEPLCLPESEDT